MSFLWKYSWKDFVLVLRIYAILYFAKWMIEYRSLKEILNWIQNEDLKLKTIPEKDLHFAKKVARFTDRLSRFTLFKSKCYDQALTVKYILNRRQIPSALVMGVKTDTKDEMEAHAWVRCGEKIIIGGTVAQDFTALRHFY